MLTEEERNEIINTTVERVLVAIPEVIGNLMANHAMLHKLNREFYAAHQEFAGKKDIVQKVVEAVEGRNPTLSYDKILEKAVPEIKQRIAVMQDVNSIDVPVTIPRDFSNGVI